MAVRDTLPAAASMITGRVRLAGAVVLIATVAGDPAATVVPVPPQLTLLLVGVQFARNAPVPTGAAMAGSVASIVVSS